MTATYRDDPAWRLFQFAYKADMQDWEQPSDALARRQSAAREMEQIESRYRA